MTDANADIVYLDYAATTPVDAMVAKTMTGLLTFEQDFGNPSSIHTVGRRSAVHVARAAKQLAALLNTVPDNLIFTSGATESNNLAITGAARYRESRGKHLITLRTEHKAVTDVFHALEKQGFEVTWLSPEPSGALDLAMLDAAFRDDTQLVSLMHINNETGVQADIQSIGERCRKRDVLFHVDAAQSVGKVPIDLAALPVDLMSITGHKFYGPMGIGALYVADRPGCHVEPIMFGGGQQRRRRPGTLPVHLIAGLGAAAERAGASLQQDQAHLSALRNRLWHGIRDVSGIVRNGDADVCFPAFLNVSVEDVEGESLLLALEPLCVATGSACNSQSQEPSSVLRSMGRSDAQAQSAIRFSVGRQTREEDVDFAAQKYCDAVARLRKLAPARDA
jgi:cysteine desulfurase